MDKDKARQELHKLNSEEIDWDLLNDLNADSDFKESILKSHPQLRDKVAGVNPIKHVCSCECQQKQKRKDKYKDILEYIEMYVKWALMSKEPNITVSEIKPIYDKIHQWLEEEV